MSDQKKDKRNKEEGRSKGEKEKGKGKGSDSKPKPKYVGEDARYLVCKCLGKGSFGEVYLGRDSATQKRVAIKFEDKASKNQQLEHEYEVAAALQHKMGFPEVHYYGEDETHQFRVMVMQLMGSSTEDLFERCGRQFSLKTVLMLAQQMITRLEEVHKEGFLHRDIKPDNFLMGKATKRTSDESDRVVFLIDYGLSKRYLTPVGTHIPFVDGKKLTGTPRYASKNAHDGMEQSRRDDMASLGHVLVYFAKGKLPWQKMKGPNQKVRYELIKKKKKETSLEDLCEGLPEEFLHYMQYCYGLDFEDRPNYSWLRHLFQDLFFRNGFSYDWKYDWDGNGDGVDNKCTSNKHD